MFQRHRRSVVLRRYASTYLAFTVAKLTELQRVTACGGDGTLVLTLQNGVLKDAQARTGYIADNRQFQFDGPPQTGAIYTAGFSVCANDTLALGGSTVFYQCLSGNFYNLYDQSQGGQCNQAYFEVIPCVVVGGTTITASTVSTLPSTVAVIPSPTLSPQSASHMFSTMSSTMTASSATMLMNVTVTTSTRTGTATASGSVLSTASGSVHSSTTATGTAAASPSIASSTGAASILSTGKEFAALAAGFAALVMI